MADPSIEMRRRRYLDAMGIDVWSSRSRKTEHGLIFRQDGAGGELEVCDESDDHALSDDAMALEKLQKEVAVCTRCALHPTRTQTVFGVGAGKARCMVIGEAPGAEEDRQGEPFVGRAGRLLNLMLRAIGLERGEVYITNIIKCRPPKNRDPKPEEMAACAPYLRRQIELVDPSVILAVGRVAAQHLVGSTTPIGKMRGRDYTYGQTGIPIVVTYHPAYLLRSPLEKRKSWQDLRRARRILDSRP